MHQCSTVQGRYKLCFSLLSYVSLFKMFCAVRWWWWLVQWAGSLFTWDSCLSFSLAFFFLFTYIFFDFHLHCITCIPSLRIIYALEIFRFCFFFLYMYFQPAFLCTVDTVCRHHTSYCLLPSPSLGMHVVL